MDVFRSWTITLLSITLISSIIEKFAPRGNLNKYVKLICGLVITIVIVTPVLNLIKGDFKIDSMAWNQYIKMSENELKNRAEKLQEKDSSQMLELYKISLTNDIKARFKGHREFIVTNVDAVMFEDAEDEKFGLLRKLYLRLEPSGDNNINTISTETVTYIKNQLIAAFAIKKDQIIIDLNAFSGG